MNLWSQARTFLEAAKKLQQAGMGIQAPTYFLVGHSIELSVKAFLRGCGKTETYLKKTIGHCLEKGIAQAEKQAQGSFPGLTSKEKCRIAMLNQQYKSKDLQYAKTGYRSWPLIKSIIADADKILAGVARFCKSRCAFHYGKESAVH